MRLTVLDTTLRMLHEIVPIYPGVIRTVNIRSQASAPSSDLQQKRKRKERRCCQKKYCGGRARRGPLFCLHFIKGPKDLLLYQKYKTPTITRAEESHQPLVSSLLSMLTSLPRLSVRMLLFATSSAVLSAARHPVTAFSTSSHISRVS